MSPHIDHSAKADSLERWRKKRQNIGSFVSAAFQLSTKGDTQFLVPETFPTPKPSCCGAEGQSMQSHKPLKVKDGNEDSILWDKNHFCEFMN